MSKRYSLIVTRKKSVNDKPKKSLTLTSKPGESDGLPQCDTFVEVNRRSDGAEWARDAKAELSPAELEALRAKRLRIDVAARVKALRSAGMTLAEVTKELKALGCNYSYSYITKISSALSSSVG